MMYVEAFVERKIISGDGLNSATQPNIGRMNHRLISIIAPCRNERRFIEPFLRGTLAQVSFPADRSIEILVADGMSDDGTRERIERIAALDSRVRLIENPERIVSTGLNRAIEAARGDIIIRMDVHTEYAPDYVKKCVEALEETGADNVGGAARTRAESYFQEAISVAYHSFFSVGGARFHNEDYEGYVDTVTYGCWYKHTLEELGMFDEELVRNQDDELNLRIVRCGGRIWQSRAIKSWYYPRSSIRSLFMQYSQYGYWKVRIIQKHKIPASFRHLVPGSFIGSLLIFGLLSPFDAVFFWIGATILGLYLIGNIATSIGVAATRHRVKFMPILPIIFAAYHFGYGYGFLRGCIDFCLLRRGSRKAFCDLSREQSH
jgi:succinoglycan biosynthesis protein ExoA